MRITPIYELIQSLTNAEVKQLKKRSESPQSAFLTLLGVMKSADRKDEAAFKTKFKQQHPQVDYTETKSYLYKFLLRHLTELTHEQNLVSQINYSFVTAETLLNRKLYKEAYAIYNTAKKQAEEAGFYQLSAVALKRMQNILFQTSRTDKEYTMLYELYAEEEAATELDKTTSACMQLYIRFVRLIEVHGGPTTPAVLNEFRQIAEHPLIQKHDKLPSKQARLIAFDLLTNYYRLTNQPKLLVKTIELELKHYTPDLIKDAYYAYRYVFMLHNLIGQLSNPSDIRKYQKRLEKAPTPNENTANYKRLFLLHKAQAEVYSMGKMAFEMLAEKTVVELQQPWLQQRPKERMNLVFHFMQVSLVRKNYHVALEVVLPELNNKMLEKILPQQYVGLRLFYLLILFEQKKYSLMESPLRALRYALQREAGQNKAARELAQLFSLLMRHAPAQKVRQVIHKTEVAIGNTPHFSQQEFGINSFVESEWFKQLAKQYK